MSQSAIGRILCFCFLWLGFLITNNAIAAGAVCTGHFVNPISDICWKCLFPISIGSAKVVSSSLPDTPNPGSPVCLCPTEIGIPRIGLTIGYWEPYALVDVTRVPFCLVNLGFKLPISYHNEDVGGKTSEHHGAWAASDFFHVHWYKYPLIYWLQIIVSLACVQADNFDIAYLSEFDPLWQDDELSFMINPEAILFGNPIAQAACVAESIKLTSNNQLPIDKLFWCMGGQGSTYPLTGNNASHISAIQSATLLAERFNFKLHREGVVLDTEGTMSGICRAHYQPILPKSRYRYQMTNTISDANACHPYGHTTVTWEQGHNNPTTGNNFGFLMWRKRSCCFL